MSTGKAATTTNVGSTLREMADKEALVVSITAAVKRDLKVAAAVRGETMTALVESVLREWLDQQAVPA